MNEQSKGGKVLTAEQLAAIEARDLRHRDGRTLMKDVAEGGRDRSALLSHISATAAERDRLREAVNLMKVYIERQPNDDVGMPTEIDRLLDRVAALTTSAAIEPCAYVLPSQRAESEAVAREVVASAAKEFKPEKADPYAGCAEVLALLRSAAKGEQGKCGCYRCTEARQETIDGTIPVVFARMIVCEFCGNKRCPHATDHRHACTDSNESGQPGSRFPATPERKP